MWTRLRYLLINWLLPIDMDAYENERDAKAREAHRRNWMAVKNHHA